MKKQEALQQGLNYTGMAFSKYDYKSKEIYKQRIKQYKLKYNCRFVLVDEGNGYLAYYGDENWRLILYGAKDLDLLNKTKEESLMNIKKEYEKKLLELQTWYDKHLDEFNRLKAIEKN